MSLDSLHVPSPTSLSRNRSMLSKFTDRFSNRNRNISEFYIQPDDPWRSYFPGDVVNGSVVLTVVKPVRITHLVVCLHGYVKVFKNAVAPGDGTEDSGFLGPGRGRRDGEYLGNGFASLFEDEVVLCGDGRLKEGVYKFRFELELPPYRLPSSINFERGTICYMVTSTLTRPTTISPTMSCDKRIMLLEPIDVGPLPIPKPRVISLEPVSRKTKARSKLKGASQEHISAGVSPVEPCTTCTDPRPPLSPVPSELSNSSCVSNSTQSFRVASEANSAQSRSVRNLDMQSSTASSVDKTITATMELLRGGGLPGDVLPIKISINHTKPVRSPSGIIITLFRWGQIDMYPAIPLGVTAVGKKPVYEDCYPKSRTGLGGFSFGATRSNSSFRKDLSQTFAPLIVDPTTMTASVKTSIKIPEDCFPTIAHVPGSMISFKYYVEVVLDLRGKLAAQDRFLPRLNMMTGSSSYNYSSSRQVINVTDKCHVTSNWGNNILDTDRIRREKGVVVSNLEVIIGSKDSARGQQPSTDGESATLDPLARTPRTMQETAPENQPTPQSFQDEHFLPEDGYNGYDEADTWYPYPPSEQYPSYLPDQFIPPTQPEEEVDEKTRLRRAEESLLPSQPPQEDEAGPSSPPISTPLPSAPVLTEDAEHNYNHTPDFSFTHPMAPPVDYTNSITPSAPSVETLTPVPHFTTRDIPSLLSSSPTPNRVPGPHERAREDKQELERQRLLAERSAPSDGSSSSSSSHQFDDRQPPDVAGGFTRSQVSPSAPMLTEEDIMHHSLGPGEALPRYQR
ncbi:hypothetical protein AJ80_01208 [Polytolypa hystricis UAMH7299]|uniref:Arrestin-like N-terminal domain-containing protein n=1 Tax=Polytolypa hystricis (strain UAMH7299) TaxID=1447883 RepID=A0A2B7Z1A4_POLH7|nr:hypothetical protein AJ80_01208 [Polytolypa hystricis UAMH7299]